MDPHLPDTIEPQDHAAYVDEMYAKGTFKAVTDSNNALIAGYRAKFPKSNPDHGQDARGYYWFSMVARILMQTMSLARADEDHFVCLFLCVKFFALAETDIWVKGGAAYVEPLVARIRSWPAKVNTDPGNANRQQIQKYVDRFNARVAALEASKHAPRVETYNQFQA